MAEFEKRHFNLRRRFDTASEKAYKVVKEVIKALSEKFDLPLFNYSRP
ncbi:PaREP1 family protein [Stygiolobus sp. CP859M]